MKKINTLVKTIKKIKRKTGWTTLKVLRKLRNARKYGINSEDYLKNYCYKKNQKELEKLGKTLEKKNLAIKETMINRNMTREEAFKLVKASHDLGFTYTRYLNNKIWEFNSDELLELFTLLEDLKKLNDFNRKFYESIVMDKTGWTLEKTKEKMAKAREKGYYAKSYIMNNLYLLEDDKIIDKNAKLKVELTSEELLQKEEKEKEKENSILKICEQKNWTKGRYRIEYYKAKLNCGCDQEEFITYKLYDKSLKKQKEYITDDIYWKLKFEYGDFKDNYLYFQDKTLFNEKFKDFVKRKWFTTEGLTYEKFKENIKDLKLIAYKPIDKMQGVGFKKFKVNESELQNSNVYEYLKNNGKAIIEEYIYQDDSTGIFNPKSLNTIRIVTMNLNGKFSIIGAVLRMGNNNDFDNWSVGGIVAGIDVKTGKINTDGSDKKGNVYKTHPLTKEKFKGHQIAKWQEIKETIKKASLVVEDMPYVGWDIAVTKNGEVELIEGNHNHDLAVIQAPYAISENIGLKSTIKPYIKKEMEFDYEKIKKKIKKA